MDDDLEELYGRPGFLLRRAHQLSVAAFVDETRHLGVTPTQYGILFLLAHRPAVDQITLARLLGVDRSTMSMVLATLVGAGLVERDRDPADGRRRVLALTASGEERLALLRVPAARSVERVLSPLTPGQRAMFIELLESLTAGLSGSVPEASDS